MGAGDAALLVGALVPTFLLSRALLWFTKGWNGGVGRLVSAHIASGVVACLMSAVGYAHGGSLDWSYSAYYLFAQTIWLGLDLFRLHQKTRRAPK
jgi:hypothetical protein